MPSPNMKEELLRIKDPFLGLVEIVGDLVGSRAKGLLDSGVPVGLDEIFYIPTVGGRRVGDIYCMCISCALGLGIQEKFKTYRGQRAIVPARFDAIYCRLR